MSDRPPITVLVIDDHQMVAESIVRLLRDEPDLDVVGVAGTAEIGIALAVEHRPDVVLMDYRLPDGNGVSAALTLRTVSPDSRVLLVTGSGSEGVLLDAIKAGCWGYIDKSRGFDELATALRLVAAGEMVLPAGQLAALLPEFVQAAPAAPLDVELTRREMEVLALMSEGYASKTMARQLGVRLNTVRNHVQSILGKLDAHSRLEAVAIASRTGLLRRDEAHGS